MSGLSLSDLQSLRDSLLKARLGGVREIQDQNGERLTWKSDAEMARALADVEARIAAMQSTATTVIRFKTSKFGERK